MKTNVLPLSASEWMGIEYFTLEDLLTGIKKDVKGKVQLLTVEAFKVELNGFPSLPSTKMRCISWDGTDITAQEEKIWNDAYKDKGFIEPIIVRDKLIPFLVCKNLSWEVREHEAITIVQKTQRPPNIWISGEQHHLQEALKNFNPTMELAKQNNPNRPPIVSIGVENNKIRELFVELSTRNRNFLRRRPISVDEMEFSEEWAIEMTIAYIWEWYRTLVTELVKPDSKIHL
jgi:hypothetical protein